MPTRSAHRTLIRQTVTLPLALLGSTGLGFAVYAATPPPEMVDITFQLEDGLKTTHDQPRVVLWIEDRQRHFVRTLYRFGKKDPKHYEDLPVSFALYSKAEKPADLDAVTGATLIWGSKGQIRLPSRWGNLDLFSGRFVLRIESAKDHAKHFANFTIPLNMKAIGKSFPDAGYVTTLTIAAAPDGTGLNPEPVMIPDPNGVPKPLPPGEVETAITVGTVVAVTPAKKVFPFMPSVTLKLDGSGDIVEYWPRKQAPETDAITARILASKKGERLQVEYTESKGSRALVLEPAPGKR
jgi:hypothetical protein